MGILPKDSVTGYRGKDQGESLRQQAGVWGMGWQLARTNILAQLGDVMRGSQYPKSLCEIDGFKVLIVRGYSGSRRIGYGNNAGNEKLSSEMATPSYLVDKSVLRASHQSLVGGSKQVQRVGLEASGNLKGQGILRKIKERALKDVTNKLDTGPVSFKPMRNGPRVKMGIAFWKGETPKSKAQEMKDQLNEFGSVKQFGLGLRVGPNTAHHPDLNRDGDKGEALNQPQIDPVRGGVGDGQVQCVLINEWCRMDDDMLNAEQDGRTIGHTKN